MILLLSLKHFTLHLSFFSIYVCLDLPKYFIIYLSCWTAIPPYLNLCKCFKVKIMLNDFVGVHELDRESSDRLTDKSNLSIFYILFMKFEINHQNYNIEIPVLCFSKIKVNTNMQCFGWALPVFHWISENSLSQGVGADLQTSLRKFLTYFPRIAWNMLPWTFRNFLWCKNKPKQEWWTWQTKNITHYDVLYSYFLD